MLGGVLLPLVARGLVERRPRAVALLARVDADRRSVRGLQRVRGRYGGGPVLLRLPRPTALVLAPDDVRRVLDETPEPFSAAASLKVAALAHFEPGAVLVSSSDHRPHRQPFNEVVLEAPAEVHSLAGPMLAAAQQEADRLLVGAAGSGELSYPAFAAGAWRMVRRVVLGDAAATGQRTTGQRAGLPPCRSCAPASSRRCACTRRRRPWADAFTPELWLDEALRADWPLVPFSAGPAGCPGRNLVLFTTSSLLARLLAEHDLRLLTPLRRGPRGQLPGTLDHVSLRFAVSARARP